MDANFSGHIIHDNFRSPLISMAGGQRVTIVHPSQMQVNLIRTVTDSAMPAISARHFLIQLRMIVTVTGLMIRSITVRQSQIQLRQMLTVICAVTRVTRAHSIQIRFQCRAPDRFVAWDQQPGMLTVIH